MEKNKLSLILIVYFLFAFVPKIIFAQANTYSCCIRNINQTSATEIQFDVILEWSGSNNAKLLFYQAGIDFNYNAISNGGTISGTFKPGSADPLLSPVQQAPNWNINASSKQIRMLAAIATPASVATPIPPTPGFRLGTFVMTNTVPFSSVSPAFIWSFITGTSTITATKLGVYLNGATTGTEVTNPSSHCIGNSGGNPNCPTAYAGGPYTSCGDVHLNGSMTNATTPTWSSTGTGTFDPNNHVLNPVYHPSAADLSSGSVFLTLTTDAGISGCTPAFSNSSATFTSIDDGFACTVDGCDQTTGQPTHQQVNCCPEVVTASNISSCGGVRLQATVYFASGGVWSTSGSGTFIPNNTDLNAIYNPSANDLTMGSVDLTLTSTGGSTSCSAATANVHLTFTSTDDGNPCTIDGCNSQTGQATHAPGNCPDLYNYNCCVKNITQTSPTTLQFDVYLEWTGSAAAKLLFLQGGLNFNYSGMANGGTITGMYLAGSADPSLPLSQQVPNWNLNSSSKQIRLLAAIATPASIAATIPGPPGFRLGTFIISNTVPFTTASTPNFTWSFAQGSATTTQTKLGVYLNGATTGSEVTIPTAHCVQSNILLNPCLNVNVDDGNPCTTDACNSQTGSITHEDSSPIVSVTPGAISCYGGTTCVTVDATGGQSPYTGTGVICNIGSGTFPFDVTDTRGCTASGTVTLSEPPKLTATISSTPSTSSLSNGTATANPAGGTPPYQYLWTPTNESTSSISGLAPGNYCVVISDANNCTVTYCIVVGSDCDLGTVAPVFGPDGVCKKQTGIVFCATIDQFAFSYEWTLPTGLTAVGSTTGPCITVKATTKFKGGFICVRAHTPCGSSAIACKNVSLITKKPGTPGAITGSSSLCPNTTSTYNISPVPGASTYVWSVTGNIQIQVQGTTSIVIKTLANFNGGSVKVKAVNCIGQSGNRSRNITKTTACRLSSSEISTHNNDDFSAMSLYPNPTNGKTILRFESTKMDHGLIRITELSGRMVAEYPMSISEGINEKEIVFENLSAGVYFIRLQTEGSFEKTLRLIKE
jgi:hypothetical protein